MPSRRPARRDPTGPPRARLDQGEYRTLAAFRYLLRHFLGFSEAAARKAGLTPHQHQALLAIKGFPNGGEVTIHDLAEQLCTRHHSAVELVDRLVESGLIVRRHDSADRRRVLLDLTAVAELRLAALSAAHLDELRRLRPTLLELIQLLSETPEHILAHGRP
jgi:DNA-binding MarR family transcriptional regulator